MPRRSVSWDTVQELAAGLPGMVEGRSYGTPAYRVGKTFLLRLWEDGDTLVVKTSFEDRDFLLGARPDLYFTTDHYRDYPIVLVRLGRISRAALTELIDSAWRRVATQRQVAERERTNPA